MVRPHRRVQAEAAGKLRGRKPKLSPRQEAHLVEQFRGGSKSPADLAELFSVGRFTSTAPSYARRSFEQVRTSAPRTNTGQLGLHGCSLVVCFVLGGRSRSRIVACRTWCLWVC